MKFKQIETKSGVPTGLHYKHTSRGTVELTHPTRPGARLHRGAVKRPTRKVHDCCSQCGSRAGLLLTTLPTHTFNRPHTAAEARAMQALADVKSLTFEHIEADRRRRKLRLCPECIKPYQEANGVLNVGQWKRQP